MKPWRVWIQDFYIRHCCRFAIKYAKSIFGNQPITACEIGVDTGYHARHMLRKLNITRLYLIDPHFTNHCRRLLKHWNDKIVWIEDYSQHVSDKVPNIDFLYIDGDSTYKGHKRDIELYAHKAKLVSGHRWNMPDSTRGIIEYANNKRKIKVGYSIPQPDWVYEVEK